jgi:hypothetical protein
VGEIIPSGRQIYDLENIHAGLVEIAPKPFSPKGNSPWQVDGREELGDKSIFCMGSVEHFCYFVDVGELWFLKLKRHDVCILGRSLNQIVGKK